MTDRRMTPATDRVALSSLRDVMMREIYTDGEPARVSVPVADLLAQPDGARDRQLNFGADVTIIEKRGDLAFVQAVRDGYCGWIRQADLTDQRPRITHRVSAPATHIYAGPDIKQRETGFLSLNARLSVVGTEGRFAQLAEGGWVPLQSISDGFASDPVEAAESLIGTPYLWGANSRQGIDCSGLVQAALHGCGLACPGDSDLQRAAFAEVEDMRRGDLLFWPGHVAMVCGDGRMIHATAWQMRVIHEDIDSAIARIDAAGDGPFLGINRPGREEISF
ncbi:C40 family peptidase [Paracoccus aerodenitrificans]|uniref:C40 family peptidase n=1 Tax=Paracoccus aerodenitrificans TaxID=3017781 RepID=UPI0022F0C333|nr:C40 family peptidase [Paracoccus aerodenitrificans]WBU63301.1 C40 family peptidase [Paracoccus aerodenitrificans]